MQGSFGPRKTTEATRFTVLSASATDAISHRPKSAMPSDGINYLSTRE